MSHRIALYGGSFDPIHVGHLIIARSVAEAINADRVLLLPTASPPHKEAGALTSAGHRAQMVRLAIEDERLFELNDHDMTREGKTYTVDTIRHFLAQFDDGTEICWIIGADSLAELADWYEVATLVDLCRIVTAARPGWDDMSLDHLTSRLSAAQIARLKENILETPRIDISATMIRHRTRTGRSIRYLVPESVRAYIEQHRLYKVDSTASAS
jgi:nicotinate-nucleotide adenylyltransferase